MTLPARSRLRAVGADHPNGTYVHGHLVFAAWQQYLAHKHNPARCGTTWDATHYPSKPDTSIAFPKVRSQEPRAPPYHKPHSR